MSEPRTVPDGYVAFGWYTGGESLRPRSATGGLRLSVAHLAPVDQTAPGSSGRPRHAYEAVCGMRKRTRRGRVETPGDVERAANRGERKWCARCWKIVHDEQEANRA